MVWGYLDRMLCASRRNTLSTLSRSPLLESYIISSTLYDIMNPCLFSECMRGPKSAEISCRAPSLYLVSFLSGDRQPATILRTTLPFSYSLYIHFQPNSQDPPLWQLP